MRCLFLTGLLCGMSASALVQSERFRLRVGVTELIRGVEIRLSQNGVTRGDSNIGFVSLCRMPASPGASA